MGHGITGYGRYERRGGMRVIHGYNGRRFSRNMVMNGVGNARIAVPPPPAIAWGFGCRMGFPSAESGDSGEEYPIAG